jgi:hypothetical protein
VQKYGRATGINAEINGLCVHSLRATAGTNALENGADIAGSGVVRPRQYRDHAALRSASTATRGQPYISGEVLAGRTPD